MQLGIAHLKASDQGDLANKQTVSSRWWLCACAFSAVAPSLHAGHLLQCVPVPLRRQPPLNPQVGETWGKLPADIKAKVEERLTGLKCVHS